MTQAAMISSDSAPSRGTGRVDLDWLGSDNFRGIVLLATLALAWPVMTAVGLSFWLEVANRIVILAIAAASLKLLMRVAGLHSMGHAVYFGVGAYCVGVPAFYGIESGYVHLALSVAVSAVLGSAIGMLALRTRGAHFIMLTLAFGQMAYFTMMSLREYGGDDGLTISTGSLFSAGLDLSSRPVLYYVSLGSLAIALFGLSRVRRSRFGLVLLAANESEPRVAASGFGIYRYRLCAFVLASVVCAFAGFLNANLTSFVTPDLISWKQSALFMFMVVLGGRGIVSGPILGACAFVLIEQVLGSKTAYWEFWFGIFLMVAVIGVRPSFAALMSRKRGAP